MKQIIVLLVVTLFCISCKTEPKNEGYTIIGKAPGVYNGIRAYLKTTTSNGKQIAIDTAIIMNETFTFKGIARNPGVHILTVDNVNGSLSLILHNEAFKIHIDKKNLLKSKIEGSEATTLYQNFNDAIGEKKAALKTTITKARRALYAKDTSAVAKLDSKIKEQKIEIEDFKFQFIKQHPKSIVSLGLLEPQTKVKDLNINKTLELFEDLDAVLKNSNKGKQLRLKLKILVEAEKKNAVLNIGNVAPNFEAPTPEGTMLSLNDVKGKVTIIDFWAAWCGPCRKENPNVVNIYNKYHADGLEIIGVSLDGTRSQKDPKKSWLDAIAKDKLTWQHVSNLNYFNDPVAKLYNINSIPATYILDGDGKIVAKNLRGKALELKIKSLLNK